MLRETGKELILHTLAAASQSRLANQVIVATDSSEIQKVVESAGGIAVMTDANHVSGSDRVAEAARQVDDEIIVNVQGDEPELDGASIDLLIQTLREQPESKIATLATPITSELAYADPACVKVVTDLKGRALYFSRRPIPALVKSDDFSNWKAKAPNGLLQHIGIYGYHNASLQEFCQLPPTTLEQMESLEQLRFLAHGYHVYVRIVEHFAQGIDTPEDYAAFVNRHGKG